MTRPIMVRASWAFLLPLTASLGCAAPGTEAGAQQVQRCEPVQRFLTEDFGMVAETERDTVDEWRTQKMLAGCRVTAAGGTQLGMADTAGLLYDRLFAAGWTRTPDPRDAPNESALRLRLDDTDCFFSVYSRIVIGTAAEMRVNRALMPGSGEARYNVLVQCVPAMAAAP